VTLYTGYKFEMPEEEGVELMGAENYASFYATEDKKK